MGKIAYKDCNFRGDTLAIIQQANQIITRYTAAGYKLTLRQLYYQFITLNVFPNSERSYKRLASIISDARYAGLVDWNAIEDRGRVVDLPSAWPSIRNILNIAVEQFQLPIWNWQPTYVELWVEKQALAGVLEPMMKKHRVPLMVNKGYSSSSAMHDAARRFKANGTYFDKDGKSVTRPRLLLYLGDHDPSGEDMVRDIADRFDVFGVRHVEVRKVGLTMDQVDEYNPPPNPAKTSDSRFEKYAEKHGTESWEVDALKPEVMHELIDSAIEEVRDQKAWDRITEREEKERKVAKAAIDELDLDDDDTNEDEES